MPATDPAELVRQSCFETAAAMREVADMLQRDANSIILLANDVTPSRVTRMTFSRLEASWLPVIEEGKAVGTHSLEMRGRIENLTKTLRTMAG